MANVTPVNPTPPLNLGRQIQTIPGIQGVAAGGSAQVQINPNRRIFNLNFQCTGIAYTTPSVTLPASAGGTRATFTATVVQGVITAVAIATAGSGQTPGTYTAVVTNPDGGNYSANITIVVAGGGTVTATPTVLSGGVSAAVPIGTFFAGQILQTVGGVNMRDITATQIASIAAYNGTNYALGELTIYYVEPCRRFTEAPDATVWDLWGQSVLQLQMPITSGITSPGLVGTYEFDADIALRRMVNSSAGPVPLLQPIAQHSQSFPVPAGASLFSITTIPFLIRPGVPLPILRLYCLGGTPGSITNMEVDQDGNKIVQLSQAQYQQQYGEYGFNTAIFDTTLTPDKDQRIWRALRCLNALILYVASSVTQQVVVIRETLPGGYTGG